MKVLTAFLYLIFSFIFLLVFTSFLLFFLTKEKERTTLLSPIVETMKTGERRVLSLFTSGLDKKITSALDGTNGTYSIVVINLRNGESYSQNPDRVYSSASLYKLWTMAVVYQQIKEGKLKKSDVLADSVQGLNSSFGIASDEAELTGGSIKLTVDRALEKMITVSDNYAALLLTKKIKLTNVTAFLKNEGLTHSKTSSPPVTTASDIALYYTKLYNKQLVDKESSEEMLALLKRQQINDRIPKYLPEELEVAHKTGELEGFKHDAGIVYTPKGDYIFVALSQTSNPSVAAERIAEVSRQVYTYFQETQK